MTHEELTDRVDALLRNRRFNDLVCLIWATDPDWVNQLVFARALSRVIPRTEA